MYEQVAVERAVYGAGQNLLICGSVQRLPREVREWKERVQFVYLDPPFMTGEKFTRKRPYGEAGWRKGSPSLTVKGYEDRFADEKAYLRFLRRMIAVSRELLKEEGVFCLHLDWRMSAQGRILCDRIFGKDRFLNEIIWAYESGGRSKRCFSRKHDTVLMFAKGEKYHFDLTRVPLARSAYRRNHMARSMDESGRMYSSIYANGKEYRYYDDDPVYPGDVWTDISHLQQRDPERAGFLTQKPMKLLERLLLPVTQEGDLVADLCCGSGTTLAVAQKLGLRFAGMDLNADAVAISAARLQTDNLTIVCPTAAGKGRLLTREAGGRFELEGIETGNPAFPENGDPLDAVEAWDLGRVEGDTFLAERRYQRSFRYPELVSSLAAAPGEVQAVLVTDAAGERRIFQREKGKCSNFPLADLQER